MAGFSENTESICQDVQTKDSVGRCFWKTGLTFVADTVLSAKMESSFGKEISAEFSAAETWLVSLPNKGRFRYYLQAVFALTRLVLI